MRLRLLNILLVLTVVGAATLAPSQESDAKPAKASDAGAKDHGSTPRVFFVEAADNGKSITVARGSFLVVRLPSTPSTGYAWAVIGDPAPLAFVSSEYEAADQQKPGASEMQVIRFKTYLAGTIELKLGYRRPWKKNVAPDKTFEVKVTIPEGPLP